MKRDRIALFGGSFNPPHLGHLEIALAAVRQFDLDEVRFIPARISPFKQADPVPDTVHRIAMTRLLVASHTDFSVWETEIDRGGVSYTTDTLRHFQTSEPESELFLLMGADAYATLDLWKDAEYIRSAVSIIVYPRSDVDIDDSEGCLRLEGEYLNVSSTHIRALIERGRSVDSLVTEPVARYIDEFDLYR